MANNIEIGMELMEDIFFNTSFFGIFGFIEIILVFGCLIIITRKKSDWKRLAFPVMIGFVVSEIYVGIAFLSIAGLIYVIDSLSVRAISGSLGAISNTLGVYRGVGTKVGRKRKREEKEVSSMIGELLKQQKMDKDIMKLVSQNKIPLSVAERITPEEFKKQFEKKLKKTPEFREARLRQRAIEQEKLKTDRKRKKEQEKFFDKQLLMMEQKSQLEKDTRERFLKDRRLMSEQGIDDAVTKQLLFQASRDEIEELRRRSEKGRIDRY